MLKINIKCYFTFITHFLLSLKKLPFYLITMKNHFLPNVAPQLIALFHYLAKMLIFL